MKDKDGVEIVEGENKSISNEDLIAKTVAGVLDGLKEQNKDVDDANNPPVDQDPFDFSAIDQEANNQNVNPNVNDQNNQNNQDNQNNNDQNNQDNKPLQDPRFDALSVGMEANTKEIEVNRRTTSMNNFILDFNNEVKGVPELETYRNEAITEAKKSIASGGYIPASDMLSYLHGRDNIGKLKNVEKNTNPQIGGKTELNPSGDDKPFDLDAASADEIKEEYKNVTF